MHPLNTVVVSRGGFESTDHYDLIESNITVVNLLRSEGFLDELISKEALQSYWVDFYRAQMLNGGFAQFVYNSRWSVPVINAVRAGLAAMGAAGHVAFFAIASARVDAVGDAKLAGFFSASLFGPNPTRDELQADGFIELHKREDLVEANYAYLRGLANLQVLSIDEMFAALESVLGRPIAR